MNTQENNKLIAEFMGFQKTNIGWYDSEETMPPLSNTYDSNTFDEHELAFHKSWDWLMPVVDKIESLGYEFFIVEDRIKIAHNTDHSIDTIINFTLGGSKREATYKAVVEFIKQYNK